MARATGTEATALERIPVRNAWHMLLYAWDLAAWRGHTPQEAERCETLLGLLAFVLEDSTRRLLHRQLSRAHVPCNRVVQGIRGRIDFTGSLKMLEFERGRARCNFSELGLDTPRNRILKATLHGLARDPRVEHSDQMRANMLRRRLAELVALMAGVPLVRISTMDFGRLQLGRNDRDYAVPLAICILIHRLEMPTEDRGDHALAALCRDEVQFERLFEAFVRNFLRHRLADCSVWAERLDWNADVSSVFAPSMRTDITVEWRTPHRRLVIDTKFSGTTLATTQYGGAKFKSPNLYQLYAYLRTQEHLSAAHRRAEGMLLYPKTQRDLDETMVVQGHRIRVATVDLAKPWECIERRLIELVAGSSSVAAPPRGGTRVPDVRPQRPGEP